MNWFQLNEMVANPKKFQLIFFGIREDHELSIEINGAVIKMSATVKLLDVTIDSKLRFKTFSRVVRYLEPQKASLLYNSFILTNFNYCPLIWMFCGKTTNDKVNSVHKHALRVLLNDYTSSSEELLHRNEEVTIHDKKLQKLMLEVYRCMTSGNPSFLWEFFNKKVLSYSLRINNLIQLPNTRTKKCGNELLSFRGSIIWNQLRDQYKAAKTGNEFKMKIKSWKGFECTCRICI